VGDLRNAAVVSPSNIKSVGTLGAELITFAEQGVSGFTTDPKSNYGIPVGAVLSRLRVVHWYLRQDFPTAPPRLYRSTPVLASTSNFSCATGGSLFQDETTGNPAVVGVEMGSGPMQSMQIRYVLDPNDTNQFSQFQMATAIGPCDSADIANNVVPQAVSKLREVRIQVVSLSDQPDLTTNLANQQIGYTTPPFEGSLWTPDGGSLTDAGPNNLTLSDPYPRRAFNIRVVPRAIQGTRL
jgi:hypothetical protein